jgi:hypothetical protein
MKKIVLAFGVAVLVVFSGCSSKEVFEPKHIKDDWKNQGNFKRTVVDTTSNVALLDDSTLLDKKKHIKVNIPQGYRLLSKSDGWVISANATGELSMQYIGDLSMTKSFHLKKTVATASVKDDVLAILFANNEMALYSISTKELLLKEQGSAPIVVNSKITSPHFIDNIVLFFTLDGKVVIIDAKRYKKIRTVIVSGEDYFNNVIYFNVLGNKIIAATGNKILSMSEKEIRLKFDIREVTYDNKNIYIATKQGEIISLTTDLKQNKKVKFPFAHFLGLVSTKNKIYALEKEGYIIELSKDLETYSIYDVSIDDGYIFIANNIFYINDEYISTQK